MLAAAAAAGAVLFLAAGGAHAIAALAFGIEGVVPCDVIVGPGNRYVTAAKHLVSDTVGIDMLAGPSELLIIADASADPEVIAADLLAQAEHDPDAVPMLIAIGPGVLDAAEECTARRLRELPTRETAAEALGNGFACEVGTLDEACAIADRIGPEHLELLVTHADRAAAIITNAGAVFIGHASAEVLGDYGAGPNHTLPTGGTSRFSAGLSVIHFLRLRTRLRIDDPTAASGLIDDARALARLEGLHAHEASAALRLR
jgi:phosphoribosyl-ATP pyrophosphohydrolase/phosphoribosyl-AMP cyclohydrolase/histidinol dehydrogenase